MKTFTKGQWYKALDKKTRAVMLVDGPVKVGFNKGDVILKVDIKDLREENGYIKGELIYETILNPPTTELAEEILKTVSPSESMRGIQWKTFGTTKADLVKATIARVK